MYDEHYCPKIYRRYYVETCVPYSYLYYINTHRPTVAAVINTSREEYV